MPEFSDSNPLAEIIPHPIFKAIPYMKNHPSIIAMDQEMDQVFISVEKKSMIFLKKLKDLKARKLHRSLILLLKL